MLSCSFGCVANNGDIPLSEGEEMLSCSFGCVANNGVTGTELNSSRKQNKSTCKLITN